MRIDDIGGKVPIVLLNEKNEAGPDDPWFAAILVNDAKRVLAGARRVPLPRDGSRPREFGFHDFTFPGIEVLGEHPMLIAKHVPLERWQRGL